MPTYNSVIGRSDATALMPEEVNNAFLRGLTAQSSVLNQFTRVPVSRAQVRFPVLSSLPAAYWVNPTDTGLKETSEVNWDNKFLNIEELAVIVPIPETVLDDAEQPIWDQVRPLCEQAAARKLDSAVYFGTNAPSSFPTNVVSAAASALNNGTVGTNAGSVGGLVADHNQVLTAVEADGYDPNQGVAARSFRSDVRQARNAFGDRFGEIAVSADNVEVDTVRYSFPMRGLWPTAGTHVVAIAFDPSEFVVGVRQDVTWKILDQAVITDGSGSIVYNLPQQDMLALRLVTRVGWQVANTINYDNSGTTRYPAGVLYHT